MANVLDKETQIQILKLLVEGNSIRSTSRLTGCHKQTVMNLLVSFGNGCQDFLDGEFRNLRLGHVEVDEMWTFVAKKQSRLTVDEKALRHDIGDVYLWYGIDQDTKLVPAFLCGKRSADSARKFMRQLASRIVFPQPDAATGHYRPGDYRTIIQISTDGFAPYPEAVEQFFGIHARFGTIIKEYKNSRMKYDPSEIVGTRRRAIFNMTGRQRSICTSHVERCNLTVRTFMKRFTRLALGFSKKLANLEAAVALHLAYYNFCWCLRMPGKSGQLRVTPAMAAGVTDRLWWMEDLFNAVLSRS